MELVLDNNVLFSLMKLDSVASYIFSMEDFEFSAPEYIKSELKQHKSECLTKSKLSEHEFEIRLNEVESKLTFFKLCEYKHFLKKAMEALPDPEDAPYLALALSITACIWSDDSHLKRQSLVKVYTTKELVKKLLSSFE